MPRPLVCVLIAGFCALDGVSAQERPPVFRVSSELVVVDLLATDRERRFVSDLQLSEIQVLEDGKPQHVEFVRLVRAGRGAQDTIPAGAAPAAVTPVGPAAGAAVPVGQRDGVRVIVVVDLQSTPAADLVRVQSAILQMVGELPAETEVMLATVWQGVTIHQAFTSDKPAIVAAVEAISLPTTGTPGLVEFFDVAQRQCGLGISPFPQLVLMGKTFIAETRQQVNSSSRALAALTRGAAALPGRKHVVLYSKGYPLNAVGYVVDMVAEAAATCSGDATQHRRAAAQELAGLEDSDTVAVLQSLIDRANRSQVSFYAIDPRGLVVTSVQAKDALSARAARSGISTRAAAVEATMPQEYLRTVAGDTGGRAFVNTNDLAQGLRRAWTDASEYYLIGYTPSTGRKKGRYHRIEVKVTRPGLDLRFRRGYYDASEADVAKSDLENALSLPGAFEQAGFDAEAEVNGRKLRIVSFIPRTAVSFRSSAATHDADVSVHAILRDPQGKLVGGKVLFSRDIALRLKDTQFASLLNSDNLEIPIEVEAPAPGTYRLVVVGRDSGGWLGARTLQLSVP